MGHYPSGPLRGAKADAWEGGHRVPFIVRWPGVVKAGSVCDQLVQQADLMATFAAVFGATLSDNAGEDSFSLLPLLKNAGAAPDDWRKAIYYYYSGEATHRVAAHDGVRSDRYKLFYLPKSDEWQLFDLEKDPQ
jgi:N-acetylglucosamine-6-sulfatase